MKYHVLIFFFLSMQFLQGQTLEFGAGVSKADFSVDDNPRFNNYSNSNLGSDVFFGISDVKFGLKVLSGVTGRFTIGLSNSGGKFRSSSGGNAGRSTFSAETSKRTITVGVYPANFHLYKRLKLNIGLLYSRLLDSTVTGGISNTGAAAIYSAGRDFDNNENILTKSQVGLSLRLAYILKITNTVELLPQYMYFIGAKSEFNGYGDGISVQKHFLGIALQKVI